MKRPSCKSLLPANFSSSVNCPQRLYLRLRKEIIVLTMLCIVVTNTSYSLDNSNANSVPLMHNQQSYRKMLTPLTGNRYIYTPSLSQANHSRNTFLPTYPVFASRFLTVPQPVISNWLSFKTGSPKECLSFNHKESTCFRSLGMCIHNKNSSLRGQTANVIMNSHPGDESWKLCKWRNHKMKTSIMVCCRMKKEQLGNPVLATRVERPTKSVITSNGSQDSESLRKLTYSLMEEGLRKMRMPEAQSLSCGLTVIPSKKTRPTSSRRWKRIVNGVSTTSVSHPWMASIFYKGRFMCGGSIISNRVIITAAHCVRHALKKETSESKAYSSLVTSKYEVMIGSSKLGYGIMHKVSHVIVHENYHVTGIYFDIALLVTQKSMMFTETVQALCLPLMTSSHSMTGMNAKMIGFGTHYFGELDIQELTRETTTQSFIVFLEQEDPCMKSSKRLKYGFRTTKDAVKSIET